METNLFKSLIVDVGDIRIGSTSDIFWEFEGLKKEDILTDTDANGKISYVIRAGCSCTADFDVTDSAVKASYKDNSNRTGSISKSVTVYYKPTDSSIEPFVKNERGVRLPNPVLGKTVLQFTANVVK